MTTFETFVDSSESRLIGVVDLVRTKAVHARAGQRHAYQPLPFLDADPVRLASRYARLGLAGIYIADLDAIVHRQPPSAALAHMIDAVAQELGTQVSSTQGSLTQSPSVLVDLGWRGDESISVEKAIARLVESNPHVHIIAASESALHCDALRRLRDVVGVSRIHLGIDYRQSKWVSGRFSESQWLDSAIELEINQATLLDVAVVGQAAGPSTSILKRCQQLRESFPDWSLVSGGGIRDESDIRALVDAGCDYCLVATMLHQSLARDRSA